MIKKLLFLIPALGLAYHGGAQTTRMVLAEEFTQASCGPCAQQNPAYNTLLKANSSTVVILKYQTSWPGYDPMHLQNATEAAARTSYYSVSGVPYVRLDGSLEPTGTAYAGAPYNVTQSMLSTQVGISADFSLSASHTISANMDSITVTITATNATSSTVSSGAAGSMKLRVALVEEDINFPQPPGTNGETEFIGVMRKMLPDAQGSTMADSWTAGQSQTYTFKAAIPDYIYDYREIAIVAFIQDDSNKDVKQSAFSSPVAIPSGTADILHANTTSTPVDYCTPDITPSVDLTNTSSSTVNSVEVELVVNGTTQGSMTHSTTIAPGGTATLSFPQTTLSSGSNMIDFQIKSVNGLPDVNKMNNMFQEKYVNVLPTTSNPFPVVSDFESVSLGGLPTNQITEDVTGRLFVVDQGISSSATAPLGGYTQSAKSFRFDFATISPGVVSSFVTEKISLSGGSQSEIQFDYAYAIRGTVTGDKLAAYLSTDCGQSWVRLWEETGGMGLETAPATASNARFYPTSPSHWKTISAFIPAADGSEIIVKIEGSSAGSNALYFDNLMVDGKPIGIEEVGQIAPRIYPNPAHDKFFIELDNSGLNTITVSNMMGQVVKEMQVEDNFKVEVNTGDLSSGIYLVTVKSDKGTSSTRINIAK